MNPYLILISLFLVAITGLVSNRLGLVPKEASSYFNKFIFYISMPAIVVVSLADSSLSEILSFLPFTLVNILILFSGYIIIYLVTKFLKGNKATKNVLLYSAVGGNVVYFGLPILLSLYGEEHFNMGIFYATIIISIGDLMGFYFLGKNSNKKLNVKKELITFLKNPIVASTIIGIILLFLGIRLPEFLTSSLETLGKTTTGLALFSLGIILNKPITNFNINLNLVSSFFKLVIMPLITYVIVYYLLGWSGAPAQTSVIMASMPTAVFTLIVADAYDLNKEFASNTIVLSSILFMITLNLWVFIQ